jgi:hypothetical protein
MNTLIATDITREAWNRAEQFHINSDSAAEWLLRKLANIEGEKARVQFQSAQICKDLDTEAQHLRQLYEGELLDYCRRKLSQAGNRRRSVAFLQGSVAFRSVAASVRVSDQSAAVTYAQAAAPALVRSVVTLDAAGYRDQAVKHLQETGELLPGVERTPEHETHRLTFGKE